MTSAELLRHEELIAPERKATRILSPNEIPPKVYFSEIAYASDFVIDVCSRMRDYILEDLSCIRDILHIEPELEVIDNGIVTLHRTLDFHAIEHMPNPKAKSVEVAYFSSNIAADIREGFSRELQLSETHPMPFNKLKSYSLSPGDIKVPVWYVHNHLDGGFPLELYFRNFAILFNNLGIERLNKN